MTDFKFKAYPKPWEIALCKSLDTVLPFTKTAATIYICIGLFNSSISWKKIMICVLLIVAFYHLHKNVKNLLGVVKNDEA